MDILQEIDDYMKESIDESVGLPVSNQTLQLKLRVSEEAQRRLRGQYLLLLSKLNEKDQIIESARGEASLNAQALRKFVEENQKLAAECASLLTQCKKWERECSLYDHDREALMDFGNEADERAKEAEIRARDLEEELERMSQELQFYKHQYDTRGVDSSPEVMPAEEKLLESILSTLPGQDEVVSGQTFLEANNEQESCQTLLRKWNCLRPTTKKVLSLVAEVRTLAKEKEQLRKNLHLAEAEGEVLYKENKILNEENMLLRQYHKERSLHGSGGRHANSASAKKNKRKSSPKSSSSPIEKKLDFNDVDSVRHPLSPLRCNSPDSRMRKK
ncbi:uncharacterized protein LOC110816609 [Carica papaya]|uniref:uncharacterized protein LOC110816609 n=1 Tax=Carica papaya TaxID=3649 RepID=UPI000B8D03D2|nr:uncharacterized protein LOC110816609 [Carica papaya]